MHNRDCWSEAGLLKSMVEIDSRKLCCFILSFQAAVQLAAGGSGGFYAFRVPNLKGERVSLEAYRGKVSLVVNLASECGYTDTHYQELTAIYKELSLNRKQPFTVLGFPCNQFGEQEPHDNKEIEKFARETYGAEFPIFGKLDVTDLTADPAFRFLKERSGKEPTWNFWKYLVNEDGDVIDAWGPRVSVESIKPMVMKAIDEAKFKRKEL